MPLFSPQDLVPLAKKNLGLRLTPNTNEANVGGAGDVIPLSHLAGANDIIEFITLSLLPELPRERMECIYNQYKQVNASSTDCMPRLILHYAAQHNIGDAKNRLSFIKQNAVKDGCLTLQVKAISSEAITLLSYYNTFNKQACRYLVINFGTSKSPKFTRQRDKYACGALAVLVLLNYNPLYGDHNLRSPMTDAFSYALYFACGKTSGSKATRDYRPRSATFLGLQRRCIL